MTKEEMKRAAYVEFDMEMLRAQTQYNKTVAPAEAEFNKVRNPARAEYDKEYSAAHVKLRKRLAEINAMPDADDEVDSEVQKAIELLKSKGATISFDK